MFSVLLLGFLTISIGIFATEDNANLNATKLVKRLGMSLLN